MAKTDKSNSDNDDEPKVFDVAKPGTSQPDTGSKPMVVGHKDMASDPSVVVKDEQAKEDSAEEPAKLSPSKKITIQPISTTEEEVGTLDKTVDSAETPNSDKPKTDSTSEETKDLKKETVAAEEVQSPEDKEKDRLQAIDDREAGLTALIKSGEYYVDINESSSSNIKTFLITLFVITLLGVVALAVLTDAEIIDLGIDLPFDLL